MTLVSIKTTAQVAPPGTVTVTTASPLPAATVGVAYTAVTMHATGGTPPYTWGATGVPAGMTLSTAGVLSGTPTTAGGNTVTVTATDVTGVASDPPTPLSLTVNAAAGAVAVTTASLPGGVVNSAYPNTQLAASGGISPYTFTVTGLPAGLSVTSGGLISGTPTTAGTASVNVTAHDSSIPTLDSPVRTLSLVVNATAGTITLAPTTLNNTWVGGSFYQVFTQSGALSPWTMTMTGMAPGASFAGQVMTGTATTIGNYTLTLSISDARTPPSTGQNVMSQVVNIGLSTWGSGVVGQPYNATITISGGTAPYTLSNITAPSWLVMNGGSNTISGNTFTLSGTPTASGALPFTFTITEHGGFSTPTTMFPAARQLLNVIAQVDAPERIFRGWVYSNSLMLMCWHPRTMLIPGTTTVLVPDTIRWYRNGVLVGDIAPRTWQQGPPVGMLLDSTGLSPNTTYSYTCSCVVSGVEGAQSPPLSVTTTPGQVSVASPPTLPAPVDDPATWLAGGTNGAPVLPTGNVWTATITAETNANSGTAGTSSSGTATNNVGCSLQFAMANAQPGDRIILTAGATYQFTPDLDFRLPANRYNATPGTGPWLYIMSSAAPELGTGGGLIPFAYDQVDETLQPVSFTTALATGATSATLAPNQPGLTDASGHWIARSGLFPTMFWGANVDTDASWPNKAELISVYYTAGSNAVHWFFGLPNGGQALAGVTVMPCVTEADFPNMATIRFRYGNNGVGFNFQGLANNVRFIGVRWQVALQSTFTNPNVLAISAVQFNSGGWGNLQPLCNHIYFDRCAFGDNYEQAWGNFGFMRYGLGTFANNCLVHQCSFRGIYSPEATDNYAITNFGGGPLCIRKTYIEGAGEGMLIGGVWVDESQVAHDLTYEYNVNAKPTYWERQINPTGGNTAFMYPGEKAKNHFEYKWGIRTRMHGNLHMQNYESQVGAGQQGRSIVYGPVDQRWGSASGSGSTVWSGNPWSVVHDADIYNNEIWNVAQTLYPFGTNPPPCLYVERINFHNNTILINPGVSRVGSILGGSATASWPNAQWGWAFTHAGPGSDLTIRNNTVIFVQTSPAFRGPGGGFGGFATFTASIGQFTSGLLADYYPGASMPRGFNRVLIVDNVLDGSIWALNDGGQSGVTVTNTWVNSFIDYNLTVRSTGMASANATYGSHWFNQVAYENIGFANAEGRTLATGIYRPPLPITNWNITSGPYATASSTGGPLGAFRGAVGTGIVIALVGSATGTVGTAYSASLSASGGTAPYTYTPIAAGWNNTFTLNSAGGLSALPEFAETVSLPVSVTDAASHSGTATITITVNPQ